MFKPFQQNTENIQAKLEIGRPGDKYEQEADAVADKVMGMSDREGMTPNQTSAGNVINMKCAKCEEEEQLQMKPLAMNNTSMNPSQK